MAKSRAVSNLKCNTQKMGQNLHLRKPGRLTRMLLIHDLSMDGHNCPTSSPIGGGWGSGGYGGGGWGGGSGGGWIGGGTPLPGVQACTPTSRGGGCGEPGTGPGAK